MIENLCRLYSARWVGGVRSQGAQSQRKGSGAEKPVQRGRGGGGGGGGTRLRSRDASAKRLGRRRRQIGHHSIQLQLLAFLEGEAKGLHSFTV